MKNKNALYLVIGLMVASFLILIGYAIYGSQLRNMPLQPGPGAICTMEAKQCPDGSYVGRQGPNCEFAACPSPSKPPVSGAGCKVGGCSGQICQDASAEPAITDCMYRPEYACYQNAKCERQASGECGWTMTASLRVCLQSPPSIR